MVNEMTNSLRQLKEGKVRKKCPVCNKTVIDFPKHIKIHQMKEKIQPVEEAITAVPSTFEDVVNEYFKYMEKFTVERQKQTESPNHTSNSLRTVMKQMVEIEMDPAKLLDPDDNYVCDLITKYLNFHLTKNKPNTVLMYCRYIEKILKLYKKRSLKTDIGKMNKGKFRNPKYDDINLEWYLRLRDFETFPRVQTCCEEIDNRNITSYAGNIKGTFYYVN